MNMSLDELEYQQLLEKYKDLFDEVRKAEKERQDAGYRNAIDQERNEVHNELKKLGERIGKNPQDILLDLLEYEDNLKEFGLPECKVGKTREILTKITYIKVGEAYIQAKEITKEIEAFIPFGSQEHWHLFDVDDYAQRAPDEREKRRRMEKIVEKMEGKVRVIEIHSRSSFHNGVTLFGVACRSEDMEEVFAFMRTHREEVSPAQEFMGKRQIEQDTEEMLREDIEFILTKELDPQETRPYLVERLRDAIKRVYFPEETRKKMEEIFREAQHEAKRIQEREDSELAGERAVEEIDRAERAYPKESDQQGKMSMKASRKGK